MLFNSFAYAVFLPVVLALYWLMKDQYRWLVILVASYFFYMCSGPQYGLIILGVTLVSFFSGRRLEKAGENETGKRKLILSCTILACMGVLFFFKYFNFVSESFHALVSLFGIHHDPVVLKIVLPVGISFYTFQTMSYVIDVYRGKTPAEHHFGKYAAFVSFFPQLVAGPIERSGNLLTQIRQKHEFDSSQALSGAKLMLWGYFKKLVIADVVSVYVQTIYDRPAAYTGFALVLASVLFAIQIYCDFSGYSDIAIGTARLFGINLMINFRSPYFSGSIREFWSRWHISLSTWFRDYVYIPLGGNRVGKIRHYANLLITFLVSGLWHGASWTFVAWGGIHGIAQVCETALGKRKPASSKAVRRVVRTILVFLFCTCAWVFFVSDSISDAFYVLTHSLAGISHPVAYLHDGFTNIGISMTTLAIIGSCILLLSFYDYVSLKKDFDVWLSSKNKGVQWLFYVVVGLLIVFLSRKGVAAEFIYFQF